MIRVVRIEKDDDAGRLVLPEVCECAQAGTAIAGSALVHDDSARGPGNLGRAIGRRIVGHDDSPHGGRGDGGEHQRQRGFLIEGRNDDVDGFGAFRERSGDLAGI